MAHITDNRVSGIVMSMTVNFRALELRKRLLTDFFVSFPEIFGNFHHVSNTVLKRVCMA